MLRRNGHMHALSFVHRILRTYLFVYCTTKVVQYTKDRASTGL